jgi:hypothetical protein
MTTGGSAMPPAGSAKRVELLNWLQLITLIGGLVLGAMALGRKEAEINQHTRSFVEVNEALKRLGDITADLSRTDVRHSEQLQALKERLQRFETHK